MKPRAQRPRSTFSPFVGAGLTVLCGLALWTMPVAEPWTNLSYDYLFRFSTRAVTNQVVLVLMDQAACLAQNQVATNWDRGLHAQFLDKLREGGCPLVVLDMRFLKRKGESDQALADAIRTNGHVVLGGDYTGPEVPVADIAQGLPPDKLFLDGAAGWGITRVEDNRSKTPRQHWPFAASAGDNLQSLPWVAARLAGAPLEEQRRERWLRYYGENGPWARFSYHIAYSNSPAYFRDKIVFVGQNPQNSDPQDKQPDKFRTPYTHWSGKAVGGVEILATEFLNLVNGDWLRRPPGWMEALVLCATGGVLGWGLCRFRPLTALGLAALAFLVVVLGAASLSYYSNYWFPWLVIAGGQVPCSFAWALVAPSPRSRGQPDIPTVRAPKTVPIAVADGRSPDLPEAPDYTIYEPPIGQGGFGKVWLVRNAIGQWQALKTVYKSKFEDGSKGYELEFHGIQKYKPISAEHPGLLHVDLVSGPKPQGYFYYVMELGDAMESGWEQNPALYRPRDLRKVLEASEGNRLPAGECVRIALVLTEVLEFLHGRGLTHRDVKPSNIIFVNGKPKLADVGLVEAVRTGDATTSRPGTPPYMPPPPEAPGTPQADVYGLGMVLYVMRTGRDPAEFPEVSTTLIDHTDPARFRSLNAVILKACQPDRSLRYASAVEMREALLAVQSALDLPPGPPPL